MIVNLYNDFGDHEQIGVGVSGLMVEIWGDLFGVGQAQLRDWS